MAAASTANHVELSLDDSDSEEVAAETPVDDKVTKLGGDEEEEIITLDSDSEDEAVILPPKKRARPEPQEVGLPGSPELICLDDDDD